MYFSVQLEMIENEVKPVLQKSERIANKIKQKVENSVMVKK